jgi:LmbE family N-acetylglucosaminyl deacetylase
MKRSLKILLSLNSLRKTLGLINFFSATKFDYHLEIVKKFSSQNILILSPHPDDDVLGVGGLIATISNETDITVAYFCDGSGGVPEGISQVDNRELGWAQKRDSSLIEKRKEEAKAAAEILGIKNQSFFGYPDGKLASGSAAVKALLDLLNKIEPAIIFTPSFLDNHPDHRVTNEILMNALSSYKYQANLQIWAYEVWTPLFPNRIFPISTVIEQKKKAIQCHQSQLESRAYDEAIIGLNRYRAGVNNAGGYAEAFFAATPKIYRELYRKS